MTARPFSWPHGNDGLTASKSRHLKPGATRAGRRRK
nr:MAG TPA: hypothetical protein [Caudoviricetes sp.]